MKSGTDANTNCVLCTYRVQGRVENVSINSNKIRYKNKNGKINGKY